MLVLACSAKEEPHPPGLGDCNDPACRTLTGTGGAVSSGGRSDSGQTADANGGSVATSDAGPQTVTFTVSRTTDSGFEMVTPYAGAVKVSAVGIDGQRVTANGAAGAGTLEQVAPGQNWFAVQFVPQNLPIIDTLQQVIVDPAHPSVALRTVTSDDMVNTLFDNALLGAFLPGRAAVVIHFRQAGKPVRGVKVLGNSAGSRVGYDSNAHYVLEPQATGIGGTALVVDIQNLSAFPMLTPLPLRYQIGNASKLIEVVAAQNFITWVDVDLQ